MQANEVRRAPSTGQWAAPNRNTPAPSFHRVKCRRDSPLPVSLGWMGPGEGRNDERHSRCEATATGSGLRASDLARHYVVDRRHAERRLGRRFAFPATQDATATLIVREPEERLMRFMSMILDGSVLAHTKSANDADNRVNRRSTVGPRIRAGGRR
jgi:hypothetical protein